MSWMALPSSMLWMVRTKTAKAAMTALSDRNQPIILGWTDCWTSTFRMRWVDRAACRGVLRQVHSKRVLAVASAEKTQPPLLLQLATDLLSQVHTGKRKGCGPVERLAIPFCEGKTVSHRYLPLECRRARSTGVPNRQRSAFRCWTGPLPCH